MKPPRTLAALLVAAPVLLSACEREPAPKQGTPAPAPQGLAPSSSPLANPPAGTAPISNDPKYFAIGGVAFTVPEGWKRVPPANQMRLAELQVPDPSGDITRACTVAFSTAGGDIQSNITRWAGQMHEGPGKIPQPQATTRQVAGFPITAVELSGTFSGMGEISPRPDWMLRGAIIETPEGLLFIKMTGPAETMKPAAEGWNALIDGIKRS